MMVRSAASVGVVLLVLVWSAASVGVVLLVLVRSAASDGVVLLVLVWSAASVGVVLLVLVWLPLLMYLSLFSLFIAANSFKCSHSSAAMFLYLISSPPSRPKRTSRSILQLPHQLSVTNQFSQVPLPSPRCTLNCLYQRRRHLTPPPQLTHLWSVLMSIE